MWVFFSFFFSGLIPMKRIYKICLSVYFYIVHRIYNMDRFRCRFLCVLFCFALAHPSEGSIDIHRRKSLASYYVLFVYYKTISMYGYNAWIGYMYRNSIYIYIFTLSSKRSEYVYIDSMYVGLCTICMCYIVWMWQYIAGSQEVSFHT